MLTTTCRKHFKHELAHSCTYILVDICEDLTLFEDFLVYSERKVVQFYFKSNARLKLHISSMLPVTSAIKSDILHLYLRAVDVYINVGHQPYLQSIPVLANCHAKQIDSTLEQAS